MPSPAPSPSDDPGLTWFNDLTPDDAVRELSTCCAARAWARDVALGRPYPDRAALRHRVDTAAAGLTDDDVTEALRAHPRIGESAHGTDREATWSRDEQSGTTGASDRIRAELAEGNRRYERRFGHVFLICATGLTATQLLTALRTRLEHDAATEREVVVRELGAIARLRVDTLLNHREAA